jgi:hypothetical protein
MNGQYSKPTNATSTVVRIDKSLQSVVTPHNCDSVVSSSNSLLAIKSFFCRGR